MILTPAQARVLAALIAFVREHRYPPTMRELSRLTDNGSKNGERVRILIAKGFLRRIEARRSRAVVPVVGFWPIASRNQ